MFEDVVRDQRLIDAGIFVALEMDERIFRYALMRCLLYLK
jgi:hypothetical protein